MNRFLKCAVVVFVVFTSEVSGAGIFDALVQTAAQAAIDAAADSQKMEEETRRREAWEREQEAARLAEEERRRAEAARREREAREEAARREREAREEVARRKRLAREKAEREAAEKRAIIERDRSIMKNRLEGGGAGGKDFVLVLPGGERMEMVYCPKGSFKMGSPESEIEREDEEEAQHEVVLTKDFWIGKYEVTQAQWTKVMGYNPSVHKGDSYPVENVSWIDCQKFLKRVARVESSARLPTEAEWEYACRAGSEGKFGGSGSLADMGWRSESSPHSGGQKAPNAWGIYDMHGNVAEWCYDVYADYTEAQAVDPIGASGGTFRVFRGGCFNEEFPEKACRSAARSRMPPRHKAGTIGFRIVCMSRPKNAESLKTEPNSVSRLAGTAELTAKTGITSVHPRRNQEVSETKTITLPGGATMELIWCPPGSFTMGSPTSEQGRYDDEELHEVILTKGFWLGKYEVTQRQWESVMGTNPSRFQSPDRPVENVSWEDCQAFIRTIREASPDLKVRLPTEAEWEYACRAGTESAYSGSGVLGDMGWYNDNSQGETHVVGQKQANAWGLHDMHGNVWEWCSDVFDSYPEDSVQDPVGPKSGASRVSRGGNWSTFARYCRSAYRAGRLPSNHYDGLGFRLCCSAGPRD
ncbi:MAG: formylglycine-generating enzyme family protein [bacterium]|nr:formylglycine-generating enzyme family protein [bacterium]